MKRSILVFAAFVFCNMAQAYSELERCPDAQEVRGLFDKFDTKVTGFGFVTDGRGTRYVFTESVFRWATYDVYSFDYIEANSGESRATEELHGVFYDVVLENGYDNVGVDPNTGASLILERMAYDPFTGLFFFHDGRRSCEDLELMKKLIPQLHKG